MVLDEAVDEIILSHEKTRVEDFRGIADFPAFFRILFMCVFSVVRPECQLWALCCPSVNVIGIRFVHEHISFFILCEHMGIVYHVHLHFRRKIASNDVPVIVRMDKAMQFGRGV